MNILITGSTSASGHAAIKRYASAGPIYAVARDIRKLEDLKRAHGIVPVELDFNQESDDFTAQVKALSLPRIDMIIHMCAAIPSTAKSPLDYYQVNLINARNLIENIQLSPDVKILNFSSASVYDMAGTHLDEDALKNFTHDYGASKFAFEKYLEQKMAVLEKSGQPFVLNARIPVLLTPGVQSNFISKWRNDLQAGNAVKLFNPDSAFNSCVWIGDIFDFFDLLAAKKELTFTACNVGVADKITIQEAFETLSALMEKTVPTEVVKTDRVAQDYDCSKAKKLGFKGSTVKQAIEKFITP